MQDPKSKPPNFQISKCPDHIPFSALLLVLPVLTGLMSGFVDRDKQTENVLAGALDLFAGR